MKFLTWRQQLHAFNIVIYYFITAFTGFQLPALLALTHTYANRNWQLLCFACTRSLAFCLSRCCFRSYYRWKLVRVLYRCQRPTGWHKAIYWFASENCAMYFNNKTLITESKESFIFRNGADDYCIPICDSQIFHPLYYYIFLHCLAYSFWVFVCKNNSIQIESVDEMKWNKLKSWTQYTNN